MNKKKRKKKSAMTLSEEISNDLRRKSQDLYSDITWTVTCVVNQL